MNSLKKFMQSKILTKIILLLVILSGLILFTTLLFYFTPPNSSQSDSLTSVPVIGSTISSQQIVNSVLDIDQVELPIRLKIPSINVDAPIEYVGLTPNGEMDTPKSYVNVGWFNLGQRPGENGSAVITGHYSLINNKPGVFDNLHKLRKDDKIYIIDEKGKNIIFVVRKIQRYGKNDNSSGIFDSNDGKAHLNIITCVGVWNKAEETFSERLVVFTDKE